MVYKYSELVNKIGSRRKADSLIEKGSYLKVSRGVYRDKNDLFGTCEELFAKYKNITLTLLSAIDYYDLSDYIPDKFYVSSISNGTPIKDKRVSQIYMNKEFFYLGRDKINTENGYIYIYNIERLLIEVIRFKKRLPYECYKEVCNSYRDLVKKEKIDLTKVVKYAKQITHGNGILNTILEVIL